MQINKKNLWKPSFVAATLFLIWFFVPGEMLGWNTLGQSGFSLMFYANHWELLVSLLAVLYLIVGNLTGDLNLEVYAKRAVLTGLVFFLVIEVFTSMSIGFFVSVFLGLFLWWETSKNES